MFLDKDIYTHTGHTLTHPHISTQIPHIPQSCERGAKTLALCAVIHGVLTLHSSHQNLVRHLSVVGGIVES